MPFDPSRLHSINTVEKLEQTVSQLSREELAVFRDWFSEFDAEAWDRQFEQGVAHGRLDALADEAIKDFEQGRCTSL
ncbi:hypothetical protein BH23VER1_BH23VER1_20620 [soil metagenome]